MTLPVSSEYPAGKFHFRESWMRCLINLLGVTEYFSSQMYYLSRKSREDRPIVLAIFSVSSDPGKILQSLRAALGVIVLEVCVLSAARHRCPSKITCL